MNINTLERHEAKYEQLSASFEELDIPKKDKTAILLAPAIGTAYAAIAFVKAPWFAYAFFTVTVIFLFIRIFPTKTNHGNEDKKT